LNGFQQLSEIIRAINLIIFDELSRELPRKKGEEQPPVPPEVFDEEADIEEELKEGDDLAKP
jgi:hypothetical protein